MNITSLLMVIEANHFGGFCGCYKLSNLLRDISARFVNRVVVFMGISEGFESRRACEAADRA